MGQLISKIAEPVQSVAHILEGCRKRKRSTNSSSTNSEENNSETQSPKKRKLLTTTQYIYQALFKEEKSSDISIMALGKIWKLHKVYLSQSPYFYSMFNGSWKESCQDFVHIKILDDRITVEALEAVFGSLYSDEIEVEPQGVVSILATATLFHLDGIIDRCIEVMLETINEDTVVSYYEAAYQYGCQSVKNAAFVWLEMNILCIYIKNPNLLRQINVELMTALISSQDLYVIQTEFSLYTLLRTWSYLLLHPNYDPENSQQLQEQKESSDAMSSNSSWESSNTSNHNTVIQQYFIQRPEKCPFIYSSDGQKYIKPFLALRAQYLTNHHTDLRIVLNDNIIPKEWLHQYISNHWNLVLKVDHLPEKGPQNLEPEIFYENCMRCGRILLDPGYQKWRWTGFNFGLDLILIVDTRVLSIRRHHRNEHERLLSLQGKRQFMIRVSATSINSQRQPKFTQNSEIISLSLEKNEEVKLLSMDAKLVYPLLLSVNILVAPPAPPIIKQNLVCDEFASVPISEFGENCGRSITPTNNNINESAVCVVQRSPPNEALIPSNLMHQPLASSAATTGSSNTSSAASNCSISSADLS